MPALPAIQTGAGTQTYAPLVDRPYSPTPVLSRVMPAAPGMSRMSSTSSAASSDSYTTTPTGYASTERHDYTQHHGGSEETLSAGTPNANPGSKGKGRAREQEQEQVDEGDVGDYKDRERERERKGKMRAEGGGQGRNRVWDEEQGRAEEVYGNAVYPPTNEEEEEERKIQEVSLGQMV